MKWKNHWFDFALISIFKPPLCYKQKISTSGSTLKIEQNKNNEKHQFTKGENNYNPEQKTSLDLLPLY